MDGPLQAEKLHTAIFDRHREVNIIASSGPAASSQAAEDEVRRRYADIIGRSFVKSLVIVLAPIQI